MAAIYSAWFIGSVTIAAQTFTVNGVAVVVPAGTYYLSDPTAGLSLLAATAAAMVPQAAGATAVLLGSGKCRLTATGNFTVTWGTATTLRDLLGFTGNLAAAATYTASLYSDLWWSPGKPALFALSPLGITGQTRYILSQSAYTGKGSQHRTGRVCTSASRSPTSIASGSKQRTQTPRRAASTRHGSRRSPCARPASRSTTTRSRTPPRPRPTPTLQCTARTSNPSAARRPTSTSAAAA